MKYLTLGSFALFVLGGCANQVAPLHDNPRVPAAQVRDRMGLLRANAAVTPVGDGVRLQVVAINLPAGAYGVHVHTIGRCEGPGFESAGGHWNPTNHQHGRENPLGAHKGDLPNLRIGPDGRGRMELTIPRASLRGASNRLLDADGAALVIHAAADDYRTDPSGNSGARIACGVFK